MSEPLIKTPGVFGDNGNFLLERELGTGGMGGVYMGRDKMLDRPVAVKVMNRELGADAEFVEKFKKEAQSAARLIHPNIAQVYSYGICDGLPYIAMELAAGGSLYSVMNANQGKTDVPRILKICQQVAQALQCSSDQGFVHGDVKPENILLDANGNAKLVDFGLAAMQKDTSEIWGTPYYISPEKVKKEPVDFRADMYSLGGTLYHALTGVAPFEGEDSIAVVKKRFEGEPKKPSEVRSDITPAVDALVMKMLALNKEERYPTFEALIEAFKDVLTNGLTSSSSEKKEEASSTAKKPTTNGKRMTTIRGRRTVMMKRPHGGTAIKKKIEGEEGDEGALDEAEKSKSSEEDDEDERGGNLGVKVVLFVLGGLLLIGGVIGGLIWYQVADKKARAAEEQAQIVGGFEKARAAVQDTLVKAAKFADEFDAFAAKAVAECQKPTDELLKILPPEHGALLKPGPTKELLDAIASTNEAPKVEAAAPASTNAPAAVATNAPVAAATAPAPASAAAAAKSAPTNAPAKAAEKPAATAPEKADDKPAAPPPQVVITMNELWERAYGCQASAVRVRHAVRKILKKGEEADEIKEQTRENMEKLADLSRALVDMLDQVKTSKDVENVSKGITFIKTKGEKTYEQTVKRLRLDKLEADRKAKAEAAEAAEKARQEKLAEERKAKVEEEVQAAKAKFDAIVAQGCIRQLDWKTSLRLLENAKVEMKTPEGQIAVDREIRKVSDMKQVQDLFIKNMRGYQFAKSKLKGAKVVSIGEKDIQLEKGKQKLKLTWQKFIKDYYGNLIESLNRFVFNGRKNCGLSQKDVARSLIGGALILQIVCGEEGNALQLSETLAKQAVKEFPDYQNIVKETFPDIKFEDAAAEE